jgi:hypothetical protein
VHTLQYIGIREIRCGFNVTPHHRRNSFAKMFSSTFDSTMSSCKQRRSAGNVDKRNSIFIWARDRRCGMADGAEGIT